MTHASQNEIRKLFFLGLIFPLIHSCSRAFLLKMVNINSRTFDTSCHRTYFYSTWQCHEHILCFSSWPNDTKLYAVNISFKHFPIVNRTTGGGQRMRWKMMLSVVVPKESLFAAIDASPFSAKWNHWRSIILLKFEFQLIWAIKICFGLLGITNCFSYIILSANWNRFFFSFITINGRYMVYYFLPLELMDLIMEFLYFPVLHVLWELQLVFGCILTKFSFFFSGVGYAVQKNVQLKLNYQ